MKLKRKPNNRLWNGYSVKNTKCIVKDIALKALRYLVNDSYSTLKMCRSEGISLSEIINSAVKSQLYSGTW